MNQCSRLDLFLDGRLQGKALAAFTDHLGECEGCRSTVDRWERSARALHRWADGLRGSSTTRAEALALEEEARGSRQAALRPALAWAAGAFVVSAAVVLTILVLYSRPSGRMARVAETSSEAREGLAASGKRHARHVETWHKIETGSSRKAVVIGRVFLVLDRDTSVFYSEDEIESIRFRLERGTSAFVVEPVKDGIEVLVQAADLEIRVVGTRFIVVRKTGEVRIGVRRGAVGVRGPRVQSRIVKAGQMLAWEEKEAAKDPGLMDRMLDSRLEELLSLRAKDPPDKSKGPAAQNPSLWQSDGALADRKGERRGSRPPLLDHLAQGRKLLIEGRLEPARQSLMRHLSCRPADAEAWSLLGDCLRKEKKHEAAVAAYRKAIRWGSPHLADRARFLAAAILQDRLGRHRSALKLLDAYLTRGRGRPLAAEALLRKARSLLGLGRKDEAARALREVADNHKGTTSATTALRLLFRLKESGRPSAGGSKE